VQERPTWANGAGAIAAVAAFVTAVLIAGGLACLGDPGDRCGPDLVVDDRGYCGCPAGMVLDPSGPRCTTCPAGDVVRDGKCACADGLARSSPGGACARAGLGAACGPARPCPDPAYPVCHSDGYCTTSGCTSSAACGPGFACDRAASPAYCRRAPTGQGKSCASASDCAGSEATFCEALNLKTCLVEGCRVDPNSCFEGFTCCDLTKLGLGKTLCLPVATCP
jgi:hypothetical protein